MLLGQYPGLKEEGKHSETRNDSLNVCVHGHIKKESYSQCCVILYIQGQCH